MSKLLLVCLGGALGSGARYLVGLAALKLLGPGFPFGTLAVNALGSFLIGAILHSGVGSPGSPSLQLFLATGLMGGFTTYSAFNYEALEYLRLGAWTTALLYVGGMLCTCMAAGTLGLLAGRVLAGR